MCNILPVTALMLNTTVTKALYSIFFMFHCVLHVTVNYCVLKIFWFYNLDDSYAYFYTLNNIVSSWQYII